MPRTKKQKLHDTAMKTATMALWRRKHGFKVMPDMGCPFDILVDGKLKLEVKAASKKQTRYTQPMWQFNLHRHGKVPENQADLYWFYIESLPGFKEGISLIVPHAEVVGRHNIRISLRSLIVSWSKWYKRMDLFEKEERP